MATGSEPNARRSVGSIGGLADGVTSAAVASEERVSKPSKLRERVVLLRERLAEGRDKLKLARREARQAKRELAQMSRAYERSLRDLELLYQLETQMGQAETLAELSKSAVELTARVCGAEAGAMLYKPPRKPATLYLLTPASEEVQSLVIQPGEGIAALAMQRGEMLLIDRQHPLRESRKIRDLLGIRVRSALAAPLAHDNEGPCGALVLYNRQGRPSRFGEGDVALLKLVSANVSTELRLVETRRRREQAERLEAIGRILSGVMHDLRTPLAVISGYVQVMEREDRPEEREVFADKVRHQFDVVAAMQRNLLAYARGETTLLVRKVTLPSFMEQVARHNEMVAADRGVEVNIELAERGVAFFDEDKMARALDNLVTNAIEAMEEGGTLTLSTAAEGDDLVLTVQDTGPGIPRSIRGKLFEPFITSGKSQGTGLGLANVKAIVDEHSGQVAVKSSRRGSCFTLRLPGALRAGPTLLEPIS